MSGTFLAIMEQSRFRVPEESSRAWAESTIAARLDSYILRNVGQPASESNFAEVHRIYPFERVADSARSYLRAALDHLVMWADFATPLRWHPEQVLHIEYRPAYTIARAAMEASAQAVWMLGAPDAVECVRRHLCLVRWDLEEHRKSKPEGSADKVAIEQEDAELVRRVAGVLSESEIATPGGYLNLFRKVCAIPDFDQGIDEVEQLWRSASGAAHGKLWVGKELQMDAPGSPGVKVADPAGIDEALRLATYFVSYGVGKFAMWSGADPIALGSEGMRWLATQATFREDADPAVVATLRKAGFGKPDQSA